MSDDLDFDAELTGYSIAEVDTLMDTVEPEEEVDPADEAIPDQASARVRPGEIWQLGRHRLICGDALGVETIGSLMDGESATMVFTDPPHNVPTDGHVGNSGKTQHREFAMASGEMSVSEFTRY